MVAKARQAAKITKGLQSNGERLANLEAEVAELRLMLTAMMTAKQQERFAALLNGETDNDTDD